MLNLRDVRQGVMLLGTEAKSMNALPLGIDNIVLYSRIKYKALSEFALRSKLVYQHTSKISMICRLQLALLCVRVHGSNLVPRVDFSVPVKRTL